MLIVGSGLSFHNMGAFRDGGGGGRATGAEFDDALVAAVTSGGGGEAITSARATGDAGAGSSTGPESVMQSGCSSERWKALERWASLPAAPQAHPREEHLLPLLVCAGAAGRDAARAVDRGLVMGTVATSAFVFGGTQAAEAAVEAGEL